MMLSLIISWNLRLKEIMEKNNFVIREAVPEDLSSVVSLEQECFISPWANDLLFVELFVSQFNHYYVLELDNKIIGFAGISVIFDECDIRKICIANEYRRNGYGFVFLEFLQKKAREFGASSLTLEVRSKNMPARGLYEKVGFVSEGIRKKYYGNDDAVIMWKRNLE